MSGPPLPIFLLAVMTKQSDGQTVHYASSPTIQLPTASSQPAMRSPAIWAKRVKQWHTCVNSILRCASPTWAKCFLYVRTISPSLRKACEKLDFLAEQACTVISLDLAHRLVSAFND